MDKSVIFFEDNDGFRIKYVAMFDVEQLEDIRKEIINNCSEIRHVSRYNLYGVAISDIYMKQREEPLRIRNVVRKQTGVQEFFDGPDEDLYTMEYDEYIFPEIANDIDKLLKEGLSKSDASSIVKKLKNPSCYNDNNLLDDQIRNLNNKIDKIDNLDVDKKIEKLQELKKLLEQSKLNKDKKSIKIYTENVSDLISIREVDRISLEELDRVKSFMNTKIDKTNLEKIKKLKK